MSEDAMSDRWTERLSEYLDGELAERERRELETHLEGCVECRSALVGLRAVVERARALEPGAPESDLWPAIAARIGAGAGAPEHRGLPGWWGWHFTLTAPQAAAAAALLVVISAGAMWMAVGRAPWLVTRGPSATGGQPPVAGPGPAAPSPTAAPGAVPVRAVLVDPRYDATVAELQRILEQERASLDPKTVKVLERNLKIIDRAVEEARRAVEADPSSFYLRSHLARVMKQKVNLLRQATLLAGQG